MTEVAAVLWAAARSGGFSARGRRTGVYIAQGLVRSSNTGSSSIPRANSLINWQCTLEEQQRVFKKKHEIKL